MNPDDRPLRDEEWPDESDYDPDWEDGVPDEEPCPACGKNVYEGVPKCPHCGEWIDGTTEADRRSLRWFWPAFVAFLVLMILILWHGMGR